VLIIPAVQSDIMGTTVGLTDRISTHSEVYDEYERETIDDGIDGIGDIGNGVNRV